MQLPDKKKQYSAESTITVKMWHQSLLTVNVGVKFIQGLDYNKHVLSGDVVMWWCGDVVMWWCGDVVMWWCGDVVMWWCGDVWCGDIVTWLHVYMMTNDQFVSKQYLSLR